MLRLQNVLRRPSAARHNSRLTIPPPSTPRLAHFRSSAINMRRLCTLSSRWHWAQLMTKKRFPWTKLIFSMAQLPLFVHIPPQQNRALKNQSTPASGTGGKKRGGGIKDCFPESWYQRKDSAAAVYNSQGHSRLASPSH